MNPYNQSADSYLVQRVMGAGPEQQAALLMEAGQLFIRKAIKAMGEGQHLEAARCFSRVTEIINEAMLRLNHEVGGELVENLMKIYDWWTWEVFEASTTKDVVRLEALHRNMGEIRQAWEQLYERGARGAGAAQAMLRDEVV